MDKYLNREEILKASDIGFKEIKVPEWGGVVRVKGLSGKERDAFETSISIQDGKNVRLNLQNARAKLVALSVVDEENKLLFSSEDVKALGEKSAKALDRVYDVACRLSGLGDREIEGLLKNSALTQNDDSG